MLFQRGESQTVSVSIFQSQTPSSLPATASCQRSSLSQGAFGAQVSGGLAVHAEDEFAAADFDQTREIFDVDDGAVLPAVAAIALATRDGAVVVDPLARGHVVGPRHGFDEVDALADEFFARVAVDLAGRGVAIDDADGNDGIERVEEEDADRRFFPERC